MPKKAVEELDRATPTFVNSVRAKVSPTLALDFQEHVKRLHPHAEKRDQRIDDAMANPSWSETGRELESASAQEDFEREVAAAVERYSGTLERRYADGLAGLVRHVTPKPPTDVAERIALELTYREIRDSARAFPLAERDMIFTTTDEPLVVGAFMSAGPVLERPSPSALPVVVPFVSPAKIEAKLAARARAAAGSEAVRELESFEMLAGAFRSLAAVVTSAVKDSTPKPARPVDARTGKPVTTGA